ncbi:MAG: O-antigen ligase domain-containing protein, partial [Burkholderiales bacterium]
GNGKRTAMVGLPIGIAVVVIHLLRHNRLRLLLAFVSIAVLVGSLVALTPRIQTQWMEGIQEVRRALAGEVNPGSWNPRIHMIRITGGMIEDRPLTGWGVGGWNSQWQERAPEVIRNTNMPHNDFLWMGAETGLPGALAWTGLMLIGLIALWRIRNWAAAAASGAIAIAFVSSLINNGTRDATIGLPMLMLVGLLYARAFSSGAPAMAMQDEGTVASTVERP